MPDLTSRRFFLGAATTAAAGRVLGANDRINVAIVGLGGRGTNHLNIYSRLPEATVVGLCDVNHGSLSEPRALRGLFDRQVFAQPAVGSFGNVGKGFLRGPNLVSVDAGIFKSIPLRERVQLQLRAEFFNFFNRVNLSYPSTWVNGATVGQLALKLTF